MRRCVIFDEKGRLIWWAFRTEDVDFTQDDVDAVIKIFDVKAPVVFLNPSDDELLSLEAAKTPLTQPKYEGGEVVTESYDTWLSATKIDHPSPKDGDAEIIDPGLIGGLDP